MKNITEKNKLIAEFLGKNTPLIDRNDGYTKDLKVFSYKDLSFHKSWDWLMPVIKKITVLDDFQNDYEFNALFWDTFTQLGIEDIFNQSVEFIKWYNADK